MKTSEYKTMADRERTYWWHLGRLKIIETHLQKLSKQKNGKLKILNVGCGTGGTIALLERYGDVDNVDISPEAIKFMKKSGYDNAVLVEGVQLPFKSGAYDVVCAFDVLEHIEEDIEALQEWGRVLKKKGEVLLTVPAYQWLWSDHDVSLHHKRRYTKSRLRQDGKRAGLKTKKATYAISFSLPMVAGFRFIKKLTNKEVTEETSYVKLPNIVNSLFSQLLYLEAKLHAFMTLPFGTSVLARFQKVEQEK